MGNDKATAAALERAAQLVLKYGKRWPRLSKARKAVRQYASAAGITFAQAENEVTDEAMRLKDNAARVPAKR